MGNVNCVMELLQMNQEEMLEIENTVVEIKNAFDEFISRLDMTEERISELREYIDRILENWKANRKTKKP